MEEENRLIEERRAKLKSLRDKGAAFPNDFGREHYAADLVAKHGGSTNEQLEAAAIKVTVAGRLMLKRVMGKACFGTLRDMTGSIQIFVSDGDTGSEALAAFKQFDLGDIVGVGGDLFKTRTGELTVKVKQLNTIKAMSRNASTLRPRAVLLSVLLIGGWCSELKVGIGFLKGRRSFVKRRSNEW